MYDFKLYLGSFYCPPKCFEAEYLKESNKSLTRIMTNKNAHFLVVGDFCCGDMEWSTMQVPEGVPQRQFSYSVNFWKLHKITAYPHSK